MHSTLCTMNNNLPQLTSLRGLAALWVMSFHMLQSLVPLRGWVTLNDAIKSISSPIDISPIFTGWAGVHIFFVLSGFVLYLSIITNEPINIKRYINRRFLRILPAYWAQMFLLFIASSLGWLGSYSLGNWVSHIFLLHNFDFLWSTSINAVWWTLPIELEFYILLPFIVMFTRKFGVSCFVIISAITSVIYKIYLFPYIINETIEYKAWVFGQLPARLVMFALGMLGAEIYLKSSCKQYSQIFLLIGILGGWFVLKWIRYVGGELFWDGHLNMVYIFDMLLAVPIMFAILGIAYGSLNWLLLNKPALYIGTISYSIYLWHDLIIKLIMHPTIDYRLGIVLCFIVTLFVASISYHMVEARFLKKRIV